jgi:hypothetical protein
MKAKAKARASRPARRSAKFDATLVYMDEPLVVTLIAGKHTRIVAVAIKDEDSSKSMFFAVSVTKRDWTRYLDGVTDIRYLFTETVVKTYFTFDLEEIDSKNIISMTVWHRSAPEDWLPSPRFFSENHTEDYAAVEDRPADLEKLLIDGEWQLPEFGRFQQRFSDIYAFLVAEKAWSSDNTPEPYKKELLKAFVSRPFQGGSSYVHLFDDLENSVRRAERLELSGISYHSPGYVLVLGKNDIFEHMKIILENFVENRFAINKEYKKIWKYLSENRYLQLAAENFGTNNPAAPYIINTSEGLANAMGVPNVEALRGLSGGNALVQAKIVLAIHRRLSEASQFFAQGRIAYPD